jgi:S-disulfanyl-L-cysteine oxidoreductase SoxD
MPVTAADGVEYTPAVLKRYPEAAALLRRLMAEKGLRVPPSTQPGSGGTVPAAVVPPRSASQTAGKRSAWTGVFTDEQARRGQASYRQSCARCHAEDLLGERAAPALVGQPFTSRWSNVTVDEVLQVIRRTMPQEAPDTLGTPTYVDIISYLLKENGAQPGTAELPADSGRLQEIMVTSRP